jgi:hypothetical protein
VNAVYQKKGVLFLSKWELIDILSTINSYLFVFGNHADFSRILRRINEDKSLSDKERDFVILDLKEVFDGSLTDFVVVPIEVSMGK